MSRIKTKEQREKFNIGLARLYAYNFNINPQNTELLIKLVCQDKWLRKGETAIELAIKKLSKFNERFQTELLEAAVSGEYQGLVFPNSKKQEEQFLRHANRENQGSVASNIQRLERLTAIRNNQ